MGVAHGIGVNGNSDIFINLQDRVSVFGGRVEYAFPRKLWLLPRGVASALGTVGQQLSGHHVAGLLRVELSCLPVVLRGHCLGRVGATWCNVVFMWVCFSKALKHNLRVSGGFFPQVFAELADAESRRVVNELAAAVLRDEKPAAGFDKAAFLSFWSKASRVSCISTRAAL